jgi:epoxide hydrolase-like predicted phosphatase
MSLPPSALVVDWYGVMTQALDDALGTWARSDGVTRATWTAAMADWFGEYGYAMAMLNPVHALERGELEVPDFEVQLARRLTEAGADVAPTGLVARMFEHFEHAQDMVGLVHRARHAGLATALLSNSWGDTYLREGWDELFDVVVISGEVGMRKPERRIFEWTTQQLGRSPAECVFVDDHIANVRAAAEFGWVAIHHDDYGRTAAELEAVFGLPLAR